MAQQIINIGIIPDDGTGDPLRTAYDKCNDNFTELYVRSESVVMGGIISIGANTSKAAAYGQRTAIEPPAMQAAGEIIGLSIALTLALSSGTCEAQVTINGVAQTAVGQTVLLTSGGVDQTDVIVFSVPIPYNAGDRIGLITVTIGAAPIGANATLVARIGDT